MPVSWVRSEDVTAGEGIAVIDHPVARCDDRLSHW